MRTAGNLCVIALRQDKEVIPGHSHSLVFQARCAMWSHANYSWKFNSVVTCEID